MFAQMGITRSDVELLSNVLLLGVNAYFAIKMNSAKVDNEIMKTLREEKVELEEEVKILSHKVRVLTIKQRKENGTNEHKLA